MRCSQDICYQGIIVDFLKYYKVNAVMLENHPNLERYL